VKTMISEKPKICQWIKLKPVFTMPVLDCSRTGWLVLHIILFSRGDRKLGVLIKILLSNLTVTGDISIALMGLIYLVLCLFPFS
jgi:hypothetical protein